MKKLTKLTAVVLITILVIQLSSVTAFAVEEKEFIVEQSEGYTQVFSITNIIESKEGIDQDYIIKAQGPARLTCDFIFDNINITYNNTVYSDGLDKLISSIIKEINKVIIPDGPVLPRHYDSGYTLEFYKPGHYFVEIEFGYYYLSLSIEIAGETAEDAKENIDNKPAVNVIALPTASKVLVNGTEVVFEAYTINDNNYFKLRDMAKAVNGSEKQFEVMWDNDLHTINLISLKPYTAVGGEMVEGDGKTKEGILNTSPIYKDGELIELLAYNINGNNFFKLRDLAKAFDIGITWDGTTSTIGIDTSIGYSE